MARLLVSAVVTAHDRREFLSQAVGSALASGADEVLVVRNFSGPIDGAEGRYRDVPCAAEETGVKEAVGLEAAKGDVVAFLDDDDLWESEKVPHVRDLFTQDPNLVYACHSQQPIDAAGRAVTAAHPEWARRDPRQFSAWDGDDLAVLFDRIWPGNNSSTSVRRSWALDWSAALKEAGWAADRFWVAAALVDRKGIVLEEARLSRLRLHERNMSHPRGSTTEEFRREHARSSDRFARSCRTLARVATERSGSRSPVARHFARAAVGFEFFANLENGVRPRRSAVRALLHGPGHRDQGLVRAALASLVSPELARRLLYRSSLERWRLR